jgi:hypothetical protein
MTLIGYLHDNLIHDLHYSLQYSVEQELSMTLIGYLHDNLIHDLHYSLQYSVEQELFTFLEHLSSSLIFSGICVLNL